MSTLGAIDIWYDETVKRLNTEERGKYLGAFKSNDRILTIMKSGDYQLYNYDVSNHFDEDMIFIEKFDPRKVMSVVYTESQSKLPFVKRFSIEQTERKLCFVGDSHSKLLEYSLDYLPMLKVQYKSVKDRKNLSQLINLDEFIGIKSVKAKGKRLTTEKIKSIEWMEPLAYEYPPLENEDPKSEGEEETVEQEEIVEDVIAEQEKQVEPQKEEKVEEPEVKEEPPVEKAVVENKKEEPKPTKYKEIKKSKAIQQEKPKEEKPEVEKPKAEKAKVEKKVSPAKIEKPVKEEPKEEAPISAIEFEIEMDDNHVIIEPSKKRKKRPRISDNKNKGGSSDSQITLDFE